MNEGTEVAHEATTTAGRARTPLRGRRPLAIAVVAVLLIAAVSSVILLSRQSEETVKIGVIVAESSTFSHTEEIEAALEMAVESVNKWGGIGLTKVEMIVTETPTDNASALSAFEALEQEHRPLFYITVGCELLSILGPVVEEAQVPLIGLGSAPGLTEGLDWMYRFYVSASSEATAAISILDDLNVTTLGVLYSLDPHGCGINDALEEEFTALGGTVESEGFAEVSGTSATISNLSDNEAIFCVGSCSELIEMLAAIDESAYTGHVITASCGSIPPMWELPEAQGVYVSAPLIYRAENIYAQEFIEELENEYGILSTHHGAVVYDTVRLVHGLMEGHDLTREVLGEQLQGGFIFTGVVGVVRVDPGIHDIDLAVFPALITEGGLRYL